MITLEQIAKDCGADEDLLRDVMEDNFQTEGALEEELCETIGALYRRIEKLEEEKKVAVFALQCVKDEYCEGGMLDGTPIEKIILAAIETVAGYADEQLPESIGDDGSIAIQHPPSPADAPCLTIRQFFSAARAVKEYEEKKGVWTGGAVIVRLDKDEGLYQAIPRAYLSDASYLGSRDAVDIDEVRSLI
jgi:hypothetical protein